MGLQPPLQQRISPPPGPPSLAPPLQPPPTSHRNRRPGTHHQIDQPAWAAHLVEHSPPGGPELEPAVNRYSSLLSAVETHRPDVACRWPRSDVGEVHVGDPSTIRRPGRIEILTG